MSGDDQPPPSDESSQRFPTVGVGTSAGDVHAPHELQSINAELKTVNSELKTKLESVSRAHSDIQNLMTATDVGILFLDPQLRINRFTPTIARLFNIKPGDEGRSIADFTHSLDYESLAADAGAVLRDLSAIEREVRDETGSWYLMRIRPYRTVEDRVDGVVVAFADIGHLWRVEDDLGERRPFEARLSRLSRLHRNRLDTISAMATTLAHEINQPLGAASNYLSAARQVLSGQPVRFPAAEDALEKAEAQMLRAGRIISHLREFIARGEPDKVEQRLHDLIRQACELVHPAAKEANVEIVLHLEASDDLVLADPIQIEQTLLNIMRNAIEAMGDQRVRKLTIATALEDGAIRTEVRDTGRGLPSGPNIDLFIPFTSTKSNGLGVGLSISRSIIEAHYGTIWAEPNPGGGATFSFTLPLAETEQKMKDAQ